MLKSKASVVRLLRLGFFGNTPRTWSDPIDVPPELWQDKSRLWALRSLAPGGRFHFLIPWEQVMRLWTLEHYVCEPVDNKHVIIQGELFRHTVGLELTYSTEKLSLRHALVQTDGTIKHATGLKVHQLLRPVMSPESWEEIIECLDLGENPIVEFTVFDKYVGERPWRNTIIWEVREY